jgi:hypothetical protein
VAAFETALAVVVEPLPVDLDPVGADQVGVVLVGLEQVGVDSLGGRLVLGLGFVVLVVAGLELGEDRAPGERLGGPFADRVAALGVDAGDDTGSGVVDWERVVADPEQGGNVAAGGGVPDR